MHFPRDNNIRIALISCAVLFFGTPDPVSAVTVGGSCAELTGFAYKTATAARGTTSTTFEDVPDTRLSFVQGGSGGGCVVVSFTASANNVAGNALIVRVVLDDSKVCEPKGDTYFANSTDLRASAFNFICPNVGPGTHAIKMQFRSFNGGQTAFDHRTTVVHYRK